MADRPADTDLLDGKREFFSAIRCELLAVVEALDARMRRQDACPRAQRSCECTAAHLIDARDDREALTSELSFHPVQVSEPRGFPVPSVFTRACARQCATNTDSIVVLEFDFQSRESRAAGAAKELPYL
jgi:hypothetical protein